MGGEVEVNFGHGSSVDAHAAHAPPLSCTRCASDCPIAAARASPTPAHASASTSRGGAVNGEWGTSATVERKAEDEVAVAVADAPNHGLPRLCIDTDVRMVDR